MKKFSEHLKDFDKGDVLSEGAVPEEVIFFKNFLEKTTGLSMKVEKSRENNYRIKAFSPKNIELGYTQINNFGDNSDKPDWSLFGTTAGCFIGNGMDEVKKQIQKEFKKKFGSAHYGGKTPKEYGKEQSSRMSKK